MTKINSITIPRTRRALAGVLLDLRECRETLAEIDRALAEGGAINADRASELRRQINVPLRIPDAERIRMEAVELTRRLLIWIPPDYD